MSIRIVHLSDTQIRNFKRHWEYKQSYENLYASLREKKPDVIVLVGDIAHTKTQISPEFVDMCVDYFKNLAAIAPLIAIPGNHDGNLNNLTRMDAISPIIKALNNPRIQYYKDSGIYSLPSAFNGNLAVYSCFDENWPTKEQIAAKVDPVNNQITIGLFHGMIQGAILQNGQVVEESPYKLRKFLDEVDYLLLGDIHKQQFLDAEKRAGYCGSFPQQNYGETTDKGYLLWDIESKNKHTVKFIELSNVCPFYTINLGEDLSIPNFDFQKNARIRVFSKQLTVFEKKAITDKIQSQYDPYELLFMDDTNIHRQEIKIGSTNEKIENLDDITVQEKLIREFLVPCNLSDEALAKVLDINKLYNVHARERDDIFRNVQYRLGEMNFHNTFSYGENNKFDFSARRGIVGVFGKNAVGKSSLAVDIPLYCIFNRISKDGVVKNDLIINENKEDCAVSVEIGIGKERHVITRATHVYAKSGKREGDPILQGKTDVLYKVYKEDGSEEDKTAEKRQDTDMVIRQKFGTIEDFISTSMAPQWQLLGIINSGGTERLKLVGRYFDIDIFAQKHKLANEEWKSVKGQLKVFENRNFEQELLNGQSLVASIQKEIQECENTKAQHQMGVEELDSQILSLQNSIGTIRTVEVSEEELTRKIESKKKEIHEYERKQEEIISLSEKKNSFNIDSLKTLEASWDKVKELGVRAKMLEGCLCKHEDSCPTHLKIKKCREEALSIQQTLYLREDKVKAQIREWKTILIPESVDSKLELARKILFDLSKQKDTISENKEQISKNTLLWEQIDDAKNHKYGMQTLIAGLMNKLLEYSSRLGQATAVVEEVERAQREYEKIKKEYDMYFYFLSCMSKDGIAKRIISENLNIINVEIKKILSDVDFSVFLSSEEDGKAIEIYYERNGKKRRVELLSGMEKTISALAIRAALIMTTSLPKANIFVLDESFGALDVEYKDIIVKILDKLKNIFDSVYIITHDDFLKDIVDHSIEIERNEEGYSIINEG